MRTGSGQLDRSSILALAEIDVPARQEALTINTNCQPASRPSTRCFCSPVQSGRAGLRVQQTRHAEATSSADSPAKPMNASADNTRSHRVAIPVVDTGKTLLALRRKRIMTPKSTDLVRLVAALAKTASLSRVSQTRVACRRINAK